MKSLKTERLLAFGLLGLLITPALAVADGPGKVELLYGLTSPAGDTGDEEQIYGAGWVYHTSGPWHVEVRGLLGESEQIDTEDAEVEVPEALKHWGTTYVPPTITKRVERTEDGRLVSLSFGLRRVLGYGKSVKPYLAAGAGPNITEFGSDYVTYNAGAGLLFDLSDTVDLVVDGRYVGPIDKQDDVHAIAATIGVSIGK